MFDVAIIGAGPSGSMLASLLAKKGRSVVLLEEHAQPGEPVNCSGIIGVEAFRRFDLPRHEIIREIRNLRFFAPGGTTLQYRPPEVLAYAVHRSRFDIALASKAVDSGAELRTSCRVTKIQLRNDSVMLAINRDASFVKARLVVIAAGAGSNLTKQVGLGIPQRCVLGAQMECETASLEDVEIHLGKRIADSNFGWVIPYAEGRAKIGLLCKENARLALQEFARKLMFSGRVLTQQSTVRCSLLPIDIIPRSYTERTIVIGEAAGQIKTITCGGIYYGLLAAEIAADVLEIALHQKRCDANTLSHYEARWKHLLGKELRIGRKLRAVFGKLSDENIDVLFDLAKRNGITDLIHREANFDWYSDLVSAILRHTLVRAMLEPLIYAKFLH